MSLRTVRTVAGKALALLAAGLVVLVLALVVVIPRVGGGTAYTVLTGSMRPTMPPGTLVVVRPVKPEQIAVGDVVTYQIESGDPTVATHRVVAVGIDMKGDANNVDDPSEVRPEQIRGKRWYSVRYLAWPTLKVGGHVRQLVVFGAVAVLIGYALMSFAGAARDRRRSRSGSADAAVDAREKAEVGS
ncbi:MAG: signal peptidase I [Propionibacteriales bacterium]|nr:signal peptidase I [Propionibacteriales bacterium]